MTTLQIFYFKNCEDCTIAKDFKVDVDNNKIIILFQSSIMILGRENLHDIVSDFQVLNVIPISETRCDSIAYDGEMSAILCQNRNMTRISYLKCNLSSGKAKVPIYLIYIVIGTIAFFMVSVIVSLIINKKKTNKKRKEAMAKLLQEHDDQISTNVSYFLQSQPVTTKSSLSKKRSTIKKSNKSVSFKDTDTFDSSLRAVDDEN